MQSELVLDEELVLEDKLADHEVENLDAPDDPEAVEEEEEKELLLQLIYISGASVPFSQKELKALEEALNARSNIERVIGSITGKTKAVQAKIAQLKEDIKSYEAERQQHKTQIEQKQTLHQQQVSQKANDNLNAPDITKDDKEPFKKKKILDSRTEWEFAGLRKEIETRVTEMQKEANLPKSGKAEEPYTTLTPEEIQKNVQAQQAYSPTPQPSFYDGLSAEHQEMLEQHKENNPEQEQEKQEIQEQDKSAGQDISDHDHD